MPDSRRDTRSRKHRACPQKLQLFTLPHSKMDLRHLNTDEVREDAREDVLPALSSRKSSLATGLLLPNRDERCSRSPSHLGMTKDLPGWFMEMCSARPGLST